MHIFNKSIKFSIGLGVFLTGFLMSCGSGDLGDPPSQVTEVCTASLSGSPWTAQVTGVSPSNHDITTTLSRIVLNQSGPIIGLGQAAPAAKEITVTFDMTQDLGPWGSVTLIANATQFPSRLNGGAFAYLVSLNDGVNEWINLKRSGAVGDCANKGYFSCSGGVCSANSQCTVQSPSVYNSRGQWEQHQSTSNTANGFPSINIFPNCNWSSGTPSCAFNSNFFPTTPTPARLRFGTTYTAKYVLISDSYSTLNSSYTANLQVTVVKKQSAKVAQSGAFDINLILVGSRNIAASRTVKGQQNLNTLVAAVNNYFSQPNVNVKVGSVYTTELTCLNGGDQYANLGLSQLGDLLAKSSNLDPSTESKAINVFLVSSIEDDSSVDSNLTILGVDGAIGGPILNGTAVSGMVVSTFDLLDRYNPNCPASAATCNVNQVESSFFDLGQTIVHEMGHFFGLNHLSERLGNVQDPIPDTPVCTATENIGGSTYLTTNSCLNLDTNIFPNTSSTCQANCNTYTSVFSPPGYSVSRGHFCPLATACGFNYLMWWTSKNFVSGTGVGDGSIFSADEGTVINYHPVVQ